MCCWSNCFEHVILKERNYVAGFFVIDRLTYDKKHLRTHCTAFTTFPPFLSEAAYAASPQYDINHCTYV